MKKKFLTVLFIGCMIASLVGCSKPLDTAIEAGNKINGEATPTASSDTASETDSTSEQSENVDENGEYIKDTDYYGVWYDAERDCLLTIYSRTYDYICIPDHQYDSGDFDIDKDVFTSTETFGTVPHSLKDGVLELGGFKFTRIVGTDETSVTADAQKTIDDFYTRFSEAMADYYKAGEQKGSDDTVYYEGLGSECLGGYSSAWDNNVVIFYTIDKETLGMKYYEMAEEDGEKVLKLVYDGKVVVSENDGTDAKYKIDYRDIKFEKPSSDSLLFIIDNHAILMK